MSSRIVLVTEQRGKNKIILLSNCRIINIHETYLWYLQGCVHARRTAGGRRVRVEVVRRRKIKGDAASGLTARGGGAEAEEREI
jgi:hypothetical protein